MMRQVGRAWKMWGAILFLWSANAFAAEDPGNWRVTYDIVMIWVNFLILAFLIVKFAGPHLKKYLIGQRGEVALEIQQIENQRDHLIQEVEKTVKGIEETREHLKAVKGKIIAQGEAEKQAIIERARHQSRTMLEDAGRRIENLVLTAKKDFRSELIDAAANLAIKNIADFITVEDDERFLQQFMKTVGQ